MIDRAAGRSPGENPRPAENHRADTGRRLRRLGFLTLGAFDGDDPSTGLDDGLRLFERAEAQGFDGGWTRTRHLQFGISSPVAFLSAAAQRTSRMTLGTAVLPLGYENPFRLAEDWGTVDVLSRGRVQLGVSVGEPRSYDEIGEHLYGAAADRQDFSYARVEKFLSLVRGEQVSAFEGVEGIERYTGRVQPQSPGLADRVWYGAGSPRSAEWAGSQGLGMLISNVSFAGAPGPIDAERFAASQLEQISAFRAAHPQGDAAPVAKGAVVIPTDTATAEQRGVYDAYAASRRERTSVAHGPRGMMFDRDLVGPSEWIVEQMAANAAMREVDDLILELPFDFGIDEYTQILRDGAETLAPMLGWSPSV